MVPHTTLVPQTTELPQTTEVPQITEDPFTKALVPQTTEVPQITELPQIEVSTDRVALPVVGSRTAVGDRALPVARSVFASAPPMLR